MEVWSETAPQRFPRDNWKEATKWATQFALRGDGGGAEVRDRRG